MGGGEININFLNPDNNFIFSEWGKHLVEQNRLNFSDNILAFASLHDLERGIPLSVDISFIDSQIDRYVSNILKAFLILGHDYSSEQLDMMREVLASFIKTRNARSFDLASSEILEALSLEESFFPLGRPKIFCCIDSRVKSLLLFGMRGNAYHLPAGDIPDFLPKKNDPNDIFLSEGEYIRLLKSHYSENPSLFEVYDCHLGCAAKNHEVIEKCGYEVPDKGLYDDIIRKTKIRKATGDFVADIFKDKKFESIITSFNPMNGTMYYGLDRKSLLEDKEIKKSGYTPEVLNNLVKNNDIICTEDFWNDPDISRVFESNWFDLDFATRFKNDSLQLWSHLSSMKSELLPIIKEKIELIYCSNYDKPDDDTLNQTAALLLGNSYVAFLNNHAKNDNKKEYMFGEHFESVVSIAQSDRGTFLNREFIINPEKDLNDNILFACNLIMENRRNKRISKIELEKANMLFEGDMDAYSRFPVHVHFFESLNEVLESKYLQELREADFSDIYDLDWMGMTDEAFIDYLDNKISNVPSEIKYKINELREVAINLYKPQSSAIGRLLDGKIIPVFHLSGPNRDTIIILPFITNGYSEKTKNNK